jgi:hypothetical protein
VLEGELDSGVAAGRKVNTDHHRTSGIPHPYVADHHDRAAGVLCNSQRSGPQQLRDRAVQAARGHHHLAGVPGFPDQHRRWVPHHHPLDHLNPRGYRPRGGARLAYPTLGQVQHRLPMTIRHRRRHQMAEHRPHRGVHHMQRSALRASLLGGPAHRIHGIR